MHVQMELISNPFGSVRLGEHLIKNLQHHRWTRFRGGAAFAKISGLQHLLQPLRQFAATGRQVELVIGVDHHGTSYEALEQLYNALPYGSATTYILHNEHATRPTFHPKIYCFDDDESVDLVIGSGNLTSGGLFTNYELGLHVVLSKRDPDHRNLINQVDGQFARWLDLTSGATNLLDMTLLNNLRLTGLVINEKSMQRGHSAAGSPSGMGSPLRPLFGKVRVPYAPPPPPSTWPKEPGNNSVPTTPLRSPTPAVRGFLMVLTQTDVGVGQVTANTSRRSPEIFIPLKARDQQPDFWGWQGKFTQDMAHPGKMDRKNVQFQMGKLLFLATIWSYPQRSEFRLRSEVLRSAGHVGDILKIERGDDMPVEYIAEVIPQGDQDYQFWRNLCIDQPDQRNSQKFFGYY